MFHKVQNARAVRELLASSDHRMVIMQLAVKGKRKWVRHRTVKRTSRNELRSEEDRVKFKDLVGRYLEKCKTSESRKWSEVRKIIERALDEVSAHLVRHVSLKDFQSDFPEMAQAVDSIAKLNVQRREGSRRKRKRAAIAAGWSSITYNHA